MITPATETADHDHRWEETELNEPVTIPRKRFQWMIHVFVPPLEVRI